MFKKLWNEYGVLTILVAILASYSLFMLYRYFNNKNSMLSNEAMSGNENPAYAGSGGLSDQYNKQPVKAAPGCDKGTGAATSLLPAGASSDQWSQLNPSGGKGDLGNINFMKAGHLIGIDTVGQSLRNANLQVRSEPPNPQLNVGPWNQSTITPEFTRPPLEIGEGAL